MNKRAFPNYSLRMRGREAVRITYEGQDLGVFDLRGLWEEFRKTDDSNKRYVIERAIERLEGTVPRIVRRSRPYKKGKFILTPIWNPFALGRALERYRIETEVRRRRKSFFWTLLAKLRRLRF